MATTTKQQTLREKLPFLAGIIVLAGIALWGISSMSGHRPPLQLPPIQTADYQRLKQEVDTMRQQPWSSFAYNDLVNRIEASARANPTALITPQEEKELQDALMANYFLVLKTDAERYCRTENVAAVNCTPYQKELKKFPANYQQQSIRKLSAAMYVFSSVSLLHRQVNEYTATEAYNADSTMAYQERVQAILRVEELQANPSVGNLLRSDLGALTTHKQHSELFSNLCHDNLLNGYPCDKLLPNRYYSNKCQLKDCR